MYNKRTPFFVLIGLAGLAGILVMGLIINDRIGQPLPGSTDSTSLDALDIDNGDLKIDWSQYSTYNISLEETRFITKGGIYHITGSLEDAPLVINAGTDKVKIILDNVTIKNSSGPAITCYNADDLVIELVGENILTDGYKYSSSYDEDVLGAIYSKADLTFEGGGTLILTANYQDGIVGKDDVKFNGGNFVISAADDAIRGKDSVYIVGGDFNITSRSDGIKSTNDTKAGKGFVLVEGGHVKIAAGDDAIHAAKTLFINNGNIAIEKSYEGLEAQVVTINGGEISIVSSDDGINATGESLAINGGNVYVNASGDGIDSNSYVYINGGSLIVDGPTNNGNGALDSEYGIIVSGGTVIAVGASGMAEAPVTKSSQSSVSIFLDSTIPAGTKIKIKDSSDNTIIRHTAVKSFSHIAVSTSDFVQGETYTVYVGDNISETFTILDKTTIVGDANKAFGKPQFSRPAQPGVQGPSDMSTPPDANMSTPPEKPEDIKR